MYILDLSRKNIDLSFAEAEVLLAFSKHEIIDGFLFVEKVDLELLGRLAYTKCGYKLLFSSNKKSLLKDVSEYDFNKVINGSYKIWYENLGDEKLKIEINDIIWENVKDPKVDLKNPKIKINFIRIKDKIHCCRKIFENENNFDSRRPHLREGFRPISMHPRLARCLVNLTGCKEGIIVDPFAGISGILIEALLCGLEVEGYDINPVMIRISKYEFINKGFKVSQYHLEQKDFFKSNKKFDCIVTDLPYGKNTKSIDDKFYGDFLEKLDSILLKKAVVVFPDRVDVKLFNKLRNVKLVKKFNCYIHGTLSRRICIFSK